MIIAYVLVGTLFGMFAGGFVLLTGGSVLASLLAYSATGSGVTLLICLAFALPAYAQTRHELQDV